MPYLLILMSLIFVSCGKKENALSQAANSSATLEQRTFIVVKHDDGKSVLRSRMLNEFVDEKLPAREYVIKIEKGDELIGSDLDQRDLYNYATNEKNMAKIVVSFTDHDEIFFIPKDIPLNTITTRLNLKPEPGRVFKWLKTDMYSTYAGGSFFLASVNTNDIVENDQLYYEVTSELKKQYMSTPMKLVKGKEVELVITYDIFIQREVAGSFAGRNVKCTRDLAESGECGGCTYNRNIPSGEYDKTGTLPANALGMVVRVGNTTLTDSQLLPGIMGDNQFTIKLNSKYFDMENELEIRVESFNLSSVSKTTAGYNYTNNCQGRSESATITLQRKVEASILMKTAGRGYEVLKNIL